MGLCPGGGGPGHRLRRQGRPAGTCAPHGTARAAGVCHHQRRPADLSRPQRPPPDSRRTPSPWSGGTAGPGSVGFQIASAHPHQRSSCAPSRAAARGAGGLLSQDDPDRPQFRARGRRRFRLVRRAVGFDPGRCRGGGPGAGAARLLGFLLVGAGALLSAHARSAAGRHGSDRSGSDPASVRGSAVHGQPRPDGGGARRLARGVLPGTRRGPGARARQPGACGHCPRRPAGPAPGPARRGALRALGVVPCRAGPGRSGHCSVPRQTAGRRMGAGRGPAPLAGAGPAHHHGPRSSGRGRRAGAVVQRQRQRKLSRADFAALVLDRADLVLPLLPQPGSGLRAVAGASGNDGATAAARHRRPRRPDVLSPDQHSRHPARPRSASVWRSTSAPSPVRNRRRRPRNRPAAGGPGTCAAGARLR